MKLLLKSQNNKKNENNFLILPEILYVKKIFDEINFCICIQTIDSYVKIKA